MYAVVINTKVFMHGDGVGCALSTDRARIETDKQAGYG